MRRPDNDGAPATCRAVVVDDHPDSADLLVELLALRGVEACAAYDGIDALDVIERVLPSLALVDLGLPQLDGYEVARRIRAARPSAPLRLVAVTGWADAESRARALAAGFDDLLTKPVDLDAVILLADESCRS